MADTFDPKFGAVVALPFSVANATTNQSNVDMVPAGGAGTTLIAMPVGGSVIGISVTSSDNITAGTATFRAHSASTEFTSTGYPAPVLNATDSNVAYATVRPGAVRFSAGARVGVSFSASTDLAPTNTADFNAVLFVVFDPI
jgi:hypothetical protein